LLLLHPAGVTELLGRVERSDPSGSSGHSAERGSVHAAFPTPRPHAESAEHSLHQAAKDAQAKLLGADGVGVTVLLAARPVFVGSNAFTVAINEVQHGLNEGPCVSAAATNEIVRSTRIGGGEPRWPHFTPRAAALALRGVVSIAIAVADDVLGSLNVYSQTADGLHEAAPGALQHAASDVARVVGSARALALIEDGARGLGEAMGDRSDVDRGVGFLMSQHRTDVSRALVLFEEIARRDGLTPADEARRPLGGSTST
jgi:GAF domain-containing protein